MFFFFLTFFTSSPDVFIDNSAFGRVFIRLSLLFAFNRQVYRQVFSNSYSSRVFIRLLRLFAFNRQVYRQVIDNSAFSRVFIHLSSLFSVLRQVLMYFRVILLQVDVLLIFRCLCCYRQLFCALLSLFFHAYVCVCMRMCMRMCMQVCVCAYYTASLHD